MLLIWVVVPWSAAIAPLWGCELYACTSARQLCGTLLMITLVPSPGAIVGGFSEACETQLTIPAAALSSERLALPPFSAWVRTLPTVPATAPLAAAEPRAAIPSGGAGHGWKKVTKEAAAKATAV